MVEFPYEYGSDLHWLWGWGYRLQLLLDDGRAPNKCDWITFLPDPLADDALINLSTRYGQTLRQVSDALDETKNAFAVFCEESSEAATARFADWLEILCRRIDVAVKSIGAVEAPVLSSEEARNKFAYDEWQASRSYGEINAAIGRNPDWVAYPNDLSVRSAINAWAKPRNLPIRCGQPGRPKRVT